MEDYRVPRIIPLGTAFVHSGNDLGCTEVSVL